MMRLKNKMTTQAIKHWLSRLFAWWPWRKLPATGYAQTASSGNKGPLSEPAWRTTVEGASPQPGTTSVAVDHKSDESTLEGKRSALETPQEMPQAAHQLSAAEDLNTTHTTSPHTQNAEHAQRDGTAPSPTVEQRLAFMRYLAQRGLLNEGFAEGQVPDQYKRKR
jgi:hypothetical protein